MKILIAGATGMIGQALALHLAPHHELTLMGRSLNKLKRIFPHRSHVTWEEFESRGVEIAAKQDIMINLAGDNVGEKRWSTEQRHKIVNSRALTTEHIAKACAKLGEKSPRILNASACGIYGLSDTEIFTEKSKIKTPTCFLETIATLWEEALLPAEKQEIPVVKMRFGVVLSKNGGAIAKMLPMFQRGLGAVIGDGHQFFSWVLLSDVIRAIDFIITNPDINGPVNIVAPGVVTQKEFAHALAYVLKKPFFLTLPAWLIRLLFGEMGVELLLQGQSVKSDVLTQAGFRFAYPEITTALSHLSIAP